MSGQRWATGNAQRRHLISDAPFGDAGRYHAARAACSPYTRLWLDVATPEDVMRLPACRLCERKQS